MFFICLTIDRDKLSNFNTAFWGTVFKVFKKNLIIKKKISSISQGFSSAGVTETKRIRHEAIEQPEILYLILEKKITGIISIYQEKTDF